MAQAPIAFTVATAPEPHRVRTRLIIKAHPEVKQLMTRNPVTFLIGLGCVAAQVALAYLLRNQAWYWTIPVAYLVGAFLSHTLFVVIHEAAHSLVFKKMWQNVATGILANFPSVFPTAISFKNFHIKHHVFQGVHELDADLPDWYEAKLIHNYSIGKAIWLFFFPLFQVIRTARCREVATIDRYVVANIVAQVAFDAAIVYFFGWTALLYLFLSFWFSVGLHPLGARWIQEHYLTLSPSRKLIPTTAASTASTSTWAFTTSTTTCPAFRGTTCPSSKPWPPSSTSPCWPTPATPSSSSCSCSTRKSASIRASLARNAARPRSRTPACRIRT
jgi:sphingolipid delta-4 desaturase